MALQHVVAFPDGVTLTRLPIGRAAGHLWVSFVAIGMGDEHEWDISAHVGITDAQCLGGGGSYGEGVEEMQFRYVDPGLDVVQVVYRTDEGQAIVDVEDVQLPRAP
jgi:hypothetical protein